MALIPWKSNSIWSSPLTDLERLRQEMNRLFTNSLIEGERTEMADYSWNPAVDVVENDKDYAIKTDLPGLTKEDIAISVEGDRLTIKGEKKKDLSAEEKGLLRTERVYGKFVRSFALPTAVDKEKINASYKDGVLEISVPKTESIKAKEIKIKVD